MVGAIRVVSAGHCGWPALRHLMVGSGADVVNGGNEEWVEVARAVAVGAHAGAVR